MRKQAENEQYIKVGRTMEETKLSFVQDVLSSFKTALADFAAKHKAMLVTTEKDWVRLKGGSGALAELKQQSRTLPIRTVLDKTERELLIPLLQSALRKARQALASSRGR